MDDHRGGAGPVSVSVSFTAVRRCSWRCPTPSQHGTQSCRERLRMPAQSHLTGPNKTATWVSWVRIPPRPRYAGRTTASGGGSHALWGPPPGVFGAPGARVSAGGPDGLPVLLPHHLGHRRLGADREAADGAAGGGADGGGHGG